MNGFNGARRAVILASLVPTLATPIPSLPQLTEPACMIPSLTTRAPYTIHGRLTLIDENLAQVGSTCAGQGADADIHAGAPVTVTDANGRVIGRGPLGAGRNGGTSEDESMRACHFAFEVDGVPEVAVYGIGLERRGTLQFTLVQMKLQNWWVQLQLKG
jgi:hypothetical protein